MASWYNIRMKTAIVTGCTRGIGKAITESLIKHKYFVYGIYVSDTNSAQQLETKYKDSLKTFQVDVGDKQQVLSFFAQLTHETAVIDALVNNAGIDLFGKISDFPVEKWEKILAVNLTAVFLFSKYSLSLLSKSADPVIINISSRIGELDIIEPEFIPYGVTKAGVTAFTVGLSKELENIRVNAVIPAPTKTDLFDEVFTKEEEVGLIKDNKLATPEETAELAVKMILDSKYNGEVMFDPRVSHS
jgi:3-oxoacyl-[acyl-carrier protein] reductase